MVNLNDNYVFEPTNYEMVMTDLIGNTLALPYYCSVIKKLQVGADNKVLDYCSGSGILAKKISEHLKRGQVVYADVSEKWLIQAGKKLKHSTNAKSEKICKFQCKISGGAYDKILLHFSLHDFPKEYWLLIINQLIENLKPMGHLFIREPLSSTHGIPLHELINLLEHTKRVSYEYNVVKSKLMGEYVDINVILKPSEWPRRGDL